MIILGLFTINQLSENNIFSNTNLYVCIFQRSKKQVRSKICGVLQKCDRTDSVLSQ